LIHHIHVVDDKGKLRVVQARQQLQVSGDGGLNDIPIKVATTTVREVSTACGWGRTYILLFVIIHYSVNYEPILPSIIALFFFSRMKPLKWWIITRCCLSTFRLRLVVMVD